MLRRDVFVPHVDKEVRDAAQQPFVVGSHLVEPRVVFVPGRVIVAGGFPERLHDRPEVVGVLTADVFAHRGEASRHPLAERRRI